MHLKNIGKPREKSTDGHVSDCHSEINSTVNILFLMCFLCVVRCSHLYMMVYGGALAMSSSSHILFYCVNVLSPIISHISFPPAFIMLGRNPGSCIWKAYTHPLSDIFSSAVDIVSVKFTLFPKGKLLDI